MLVVGQGLAAEHEDRVFVHSGPDLGECLLVVDQAEIDRTHLGREVRVEFPERQGHDGQRRAAARGGQGTDAPGL